MTSLQIFYYPPHELLYNLINMKPIPVTIDPADTRKWIMQGLKATPAGQPRETGHNFIDPW